MTKSELTWRHRCRWVYPFTILFFYVLTSSAQTNSYAQFNNEFNFTRSLKGKWVSELNLNHTWCSTPSNPNPFHINSQWYVRGWIHYYATARWRFSAFLAYFYNRDIPELSQKEVPELRFAVQGTYYFHKVGYTLLGSFRIEDRKFWTDEDIWEASYRFWANLRFVLPLNGKTIRRGIWYAIASEEVFLKTGAVVSGKQSFDRNKLTLGGGYSITDNLQVELTYSNEFVPRSEMNEMYNTLSLGFNINNFIPMVKKKFFSKNEPLDQN